MGKGECPACVCKIPCPGGSGATFSLPLLMTYSDIPRTAARSPEVKGGEIFFLTLSKQPCNSEEEEEEEREEREEALTCVREIFGR